MFRLIAASTLAAFLLAACAPEAEDAATDAAASEAAVTPESAGEAAAPAVPEGFQLSTTLESENYTATAEIDPDILTFDPPLAWRLWTAARDQIDEFAASADADRKSADEDAAVTGEQPWFMGYTLDITHQVTGVFDDVISVSDYVGTFTGGAHPNYFLGGGIYRRGESAALPLSAFIADKAAFHELAVKALVAEKLERGHAAEDAADVEASLRETLAPSPEIPDIYEGRFVFEPSTETGKVGGISLLFSPYDIGAYAEGSFYATLPAADLAPILTDDWRGRFGGEPVVEEDDPGSDD